jgi:hypothetical protein
MILLAALVVTGVVFADARVTSVDGLAQFRAAGTPTWRDVSVGTEIPVGSEIATGIGGSAVLDLNGSTLRVGSLSRVTVAAVETTPAASRSIMHMRYGRVGADVRRSAERGTDFRIYTPISTAAVRGTEFTYDGYTLDVSHGDVALGNLAGQLHSVRAGQTSRAYRYDSIESVEATLLEERSF